VLWRRKKAKLLRPKGQQSKCSTRRARMAQIDQLLGNQHGIR